MKKTLTLFAGACFLAGSCMIAGCGGEEAPAAKPAAGSEPKADAKAADSKAAPHAAETK